MDTQYILPTPYWLLHAGESAALKAEADKLRAVVAEAEGAGRGHLPTATDARARLRDVGRVLGLAADAERERLPSRDAPQPTRTAPLRPKDAAALAEVQAEADALDRRIREVGAWHRRTGLVADARNVLPSDSAEAFAEPVPYWC